MCTLLEELVLYGLRLSPRCPTCTQSLNHHYPHFFQKRRDSYRVTLQPVIDAVDALPNLKVLDMYGCSNTTASMQYWNGSAELRVSRWLYRMCRTRWWVLGCITMFLLRADVDSVSDFAAIS